MIKSQKKPIDLKTSDDVSKGLWYLKHEKYTQAISAFREVLPSIVNKIQKKATYVKIASCYYHLGDFSKAIRFLNQMLPFSDVKPSLKPADMDEEEFHELNNCEPIIETETLDDGTKIIVQALNLKGLCQIKLEGLAKALETFLKALEYDPDSIQTHNHLGNLYTKENRYQNAIEHYKRTIERKINFLLKNFSFKFSRKSNNFKNEFMSCIFKS